MTDLTKGIIEIDGITIDSSTTSLDIVTNLKNSYEFCARSKDSKTELFVFKNKKILGKSFDVDLLFINKKISEIKLQSRYNEIKTYNELLNADVAWLNNILGTPTKTGKTGVVYAFDSFQIGAVYYECDGRSGDDEFIHISY